VLGGVDVQAFRNTEEYSFQLDNEDILKDFAQRFYKNPKEIYMDGNSLGLLSKDAEKSLLRVVNEWKTLGINGWLKGEIPWFLLWRRIGENSGSFSGC